MRKRGKEIKRKKQTEVVKGEEEEEWEERRKGVGEREEQ